MKKNTDSIKAPEDILTSTIAHVMEELHGESERACAIIGGSFLDDLLGELLEQYLFENTDVIPDLLSSENINAPLASFGARILTVYAIGLLPKNKWDALQKIKKIRNRFAHDLELSFNQQPISQLCSELIPITANYLSNVRTSREIYTTAVALLSGYLQQQIYLVKKFGIKGTYSTVLRLASRRKTRQANTISNGGSLNLVSPGKTGIS